MKNHKAKQKTIQKQTAEKIPKKQMKTKSHKKSGKNKTT